MTAVIRKLRAFRTDRNGNVVITFAFALLPLIAFTGVAIDYTRAAAARTAMQAASDATALFLSKTAATLNSTQLQQQATSYFTTLFNRPEATNTVVNATYTTTGGSQVTVTASSTITTYFMKAVGTPTVNISTLSTAKWGSSKLRVALVLDNTGSMSSDGKMTALKTATHNLLTTLQNASSTAGDIYVSLVPFARDVNVGSGNYTQPWVSFSDWEAPPPNGTPSSSVGPGSSCPYSTYDEGYRCMSGPANDSSTVNNIPSSGTYSGYICPSMDTGNSNTIRANVHYNGCYNSVPTTTTSTNTVSSGYYASCYGYSNCTCSGSNWNKVCQQTVTTTGAPYTHTWIPNSRSTWNGCITDRDKDYDVRNTTPTTSIASTLFVAQQYDYCNAQILGQTYNWTSLNNAVDGMSPNGSTNQTIGLAWGWQSLTDGDPLNPPAITDTANTQKVIILLSDGLNTQNRWDGNGSTQSSAVDTRMNLVCSNVKTAGITIYSIQVNTGGDPTSTVLQNCASDSSKFFMLTSANQIVTTFNAIGTNLAQLRIAQ